MIRLRSLLPTFLLATLSTLAIADDRVVRDFTPGDGPQSVGIVEGGEDTDTDGPQAIYAGDDGDIYLLDQNNGRILRIDPADPSKPPRALELPDDIQPTDIVVANDTIYAWDGEVRPLKATGDPGAATSQLTITRSADRIDDAVISSFAQMGSVSIDESDGLTRGLGKEPTTGRGRQTIASLGRGAVTADLRSIANDSGVEIDLRAKGSTRVFSNLKLQVGGRLGAVEVLQIDKSGRPYVFAENIPTDAGDTAAAFVARYGSNGALDGVFELPLNSGVALSRRFVAVSPDGDVYFLRNRKGATDVLGVGFRRLAKAPVINLGPPRPTTSVVAAELIHPKGANAAVRPLSRARVLETAQAFANIRWRVNAGAYGSDPDTACTGFQRVRRPGYISGKLNQEVQGIPYCWGCMGSLPQIASNIERGVKAGNICTRNDPRRDVTGVDCSAFVSATWGLSTHFTTIAIPSIAKRLTNPFDLLPGDALNKPGSHVMLFVGFTADKKAEVIESSTGGCNGKVCRNVYPLGSLLARGYAPVRYRGLAAETTAPPPATVSNVVAPPRRETSRVK